MLVRYCFTIYLVFFSVIAKANTEVPAFDLKDLKFVLKEESQTKLPSRLEKIVREMPQKLEGRNNDFFKTVAWSNEHKVWLLWAPKVQLQSSIQKDQFFQTNEGIFITFKEGGTFYCRGCEAYDLATSFSAAQYAPLKIRFAEMLFPVAEAAECPPRPSDLQVIGEKAAEQTAWNTLKSCSWSVTEMFQKAYNQGKETLQATFSGQIFKDFYQFVTGFTQMVKDISHQVLPFLAETAQKIPELYNQIICEATQEGLLHLTTAAIVPSSAPGTLTKTALFVNKVKEKVLTLGQNPKLFKILLDLREQQPNKKFSLAQAKAIAAIERKLPMEPMPFNQESLIRHFRDHQELGFRTPEGYQTAALKFVKKESPEKMVLQRTDGSWAVFDARTREFAVVNKQGRLLTYYQKNSPADTDAFQYFLNQHSLQIH